MPTSTTVIRAADRLHWTNEWLTSKQSFPATGNYDLFGNAHGVLLVHNDGAVAHRDSQGHEGVLSAGTLGYMSAGRGITHSEGNADRSHSGAPLRVIQMWLARAPASECSCPAHRSDTCSW